MKTLLIMRHAKSSHDLPVADHERPLNERGLRDAPEMGKRLKKKELVPDRIISSTAVRATETAQLVAEACGYAGELDRRGVLYHAPPESYFEVLRTLDDACHCVLMIGHNPGLAELVYRVGGEDTSFPTAAVAHLELEIDTWSEARLGGDAHLRHLWTPK